MKTAYTQALLNRYCCLRGPDKEGYSALFPQFLSYYLSKPNVVGTQKNRFTETLLLGTHNIGLEGPKRILEHAKRSLSRSLPE